MTNARIDFYKTSPDALKAMMGVEKYVNSSNLDKLLLELVKLRVSQINGCTFCVDMHCADAIKAMTTNVAHMTYKPLYLVLQVLFYGCAKIVEWSLSLGLFDLLAL